MSMLQATERRGFHARRLPLAGVLLPDMALWDVVGTLLLAGVTSLLLRVDPWRAFVVWLLVGVVLHWSLGIHTWSNRVLMGG